MRMATTTRYVMAVCLAGVLAGCGSDPVGAPVPEGALSIQPEEILSVQTAWSGFDEPTRALITDDEGWAAAWETLHANQSSVPERPEVDFQSNVILLAAMGVRPTTGYTVTIDEVHYYEDTLYVSVLERSPGPSCGTGQAITSPVHVVKVPTQATSARFDVSTRTFSC